MTDRQFDSMKSLSTRLKEVIERAKEEEEDLGTVTGATAADLANAISVAVENQEITKEGVKRIAELLMGESAPSVDGEMSAPSRTEELKAALDSAFHLVHLHGQSERRFQQSQYS